MLWIVPLLVALALLVPVVFSPVSTRASLLLSRIAIPVFGFYVANQSPRRSRQVTKLQAAHVGTTHRVYAARTLLMATVVGLVGSVLGVYVAGWMLTELAVQVETVRAALPPALSFLADLANLRELGAVQLFSLLLFSGTTVGAVLALATYWARWQFLDQKAQARASEIDASLPRTVAFIYALSRSGMSFPKVLETLTHNQDVYGESAREIGVAVRDMDAFGTDVLTALRQMGERTPSDGMEEFAENLASVLASGRSLSNFLREQYERYQEEAEALQQQYLDLLSTFAEVYVTVLVAGPLFFITVLVVIGLVIEDTLPVIRLVTYLGIPLGTFGFVVYLDSMTQGVRNPRRLEETADMAEVSGESLASIRSAADRGFVELGGETAEPRSDGGAAAERDLANYERLAAYDRFAWLREWMDDPVGNVLDRPVATLLVTGPVALLWLALRVDLGASLSALSARGEVPISYPAATGLVSVVDGPIIEATVLVLFVASLVHELRKRQIRAVEDAVPDWLDRLASVNEAGLTVVESLDRIADSDLGALSTELRRTATDIEWGADARTALRRLEIRAQSAMVSRSVTLITNAMSASGDISPVLRIAANEAQDTRRLRRERRQEMVTYLFVIYISFFVFLGIIVALSVAFIPAIESAAASTSSAGGGSAPGGVSTGVFGGLREVNTAAYQLIFFHVAAIQGVCSGLVAGQLGESRLADGTKHATVMLAIAYVVFQFI